MRQFTIGYMDIRSLLATGKNIWLSTHISSDGDGLGSEIAFYHALKSKNINARIIHNDKASERYAFLLDGVEILDAIQLDTDLLTKDDIIFIFDTHDPKLCTPLFEKLQAKGTRIVFIDHHMTVKQELENVVITSMKTPVAPENWFLR